MFNLDTLLGGLIGFISSLGILLVTELIREKGKVRIYYKIVYSKLSEGKTWGFYNRENGMTFSLPVWFEFYNTSRITKIIRDLEIILYHEGRPLKNMTQCNMIQKNGREELYGDEGAYSFIIQPKSIQQYKLHFTLRKNDLANSSEFNEIRLAYYDDKDRLCVYKMEIIEHCWEPGSLNIEGIWRRIK